TEAPNLGAPAAVSTVDVLVGWTPAVAAILADPAATAQLQVDQTNQHYVRSQINVTLRLVGTLATTYVETNAGGKDPFSNALVAVQQGTGALGALHNMRDTVGADLVSLMIKDNTYCGLGYLNPTASFGYSVVDADNGCLNGGITFAHELGHNF